MIKKRRSQRDSTAPSPQRHVAAWVLQGNPDKFDIDTYLSRQNFIYWICPQLAQHMQLGMPVFFKRSGKGGGIVAQGEIAELPKRTDQLERPELLGAELWQEMPESDPLRVGVQLHDVRLTLDEGMLPTSSLEQLKALSGHPLVTARVGTVFRLSDEQARSVFQLWYGQQSLVWWIEKALRNLENRAHLRDIYNEVRRLGYPRGGKDLNKLIRSEIQKHSSDSARFSGNPKDDLFSTQEKRSGVWELRDVRQDESVLLHDLSVIDQQQHINPTTKKALEEQKKTKTKPKVPIRYPWDQWFAKNSFVLHKGKHYWCMDYVIMQQVRNEAVRRKTRVKVQIADGIVMVNVL